MINIVNEIEAEEKKSERKIIEAEKQARIIIINTQKRANEILTGAGVLSQQEKEKIIQEIDKDALKQIDQIEQESELQLSQIKIDLTEKQKAINLIIKHILND